MSKMRTYAELKNVKVSDMTGAEMAMFTRITGSLKETKESGMFSMLTKGVRGTFRSIGDNFVQAAETTEVHDKKARIASIKEELSDLEQAHDAGEVKDVQYNLIKAQREYELENL
jgi:hypothetical protein